MPIITSSINPFSTVEPRQGVASFLDGSAIPVSKVVAASGTFVLPWTFNANDTPCTLFIIATADTNIVQSLINVYDADSIAVLTATNVVVGAPNANGIGLAISGGIITLTAHGTFTTKTTVAQVLV